jgi:hypothetical protein
MNLKIDRGFLQKTTNNFLFALFKIIVGFVTTMKNSVLLFYSVSGYNDK